MFSEDILHSKISKLSITKFFYKEKGQLLQPVIVDNNRTAQKATSSGPNHRLNSLLLSRKFVTLPIPQIPENVYLPCRTTNSI